jgi:hypothetical protein
VAYRPSRELIFIGTCAQPVASLPIKPALYLPSCSQGFDGGDSGARPDEAVSWGKIRVDAKPVKVGDCESPVMKDPSVRQIVRLSYMHLVPARIASAVLLGLGVLCASGAPQLAVEQFMVLLYALR